MAQKIKQGNIFGRIGSGIGQGLAEQIPKEIERSRLASGLNELNNQKDLSHFERFSKLSAIPGITPQMIQSGSNLLTQEARGKALSEFQSSQNQQQSSPFPQNPNMNRNNSESKIPSITKEQHLEKKQEGYIPPTIEERDSIAGEAYNSNPAFFANDPQKALDWADSKIAQEEKINLAHIQQDKNLNDIQDKVVSRLNDQSKRLNTQVPADLYSDIEDKAIQATKSKKDRGEGLTEQQAMKKYGKELDDASRSFTKLDQVGNWGITLRKPESTLRSLEQVQNTMEKLGQTDNMANLMISRNKLSPPLAYSLAEPVSKIQDLNKTLKKLPDLHEEKKIAQPFLGAIPTKESRSQKIINPEVSREKTLEIAPSLAKFVKENEKASPLAIAYELNKKGYDSESWLKYLVDNSDKLNLRARQIDQASTPINIITPWNDWWLSSFSGIK